MRRLALLVLLLFVMGGISFGQSIFTPDYTIEFTPDYTGAPVSQMTTRDSRINAVIGGYMGTTTGDAPPSAYAGNQALSIPASPNGHGDSYWGPNPPPAIGVEDNGQIRASNIVARIRGEQNGQQIKKVPRTQNLKK